MSGYPNVFVSDTIPSNDVAIGVALAAATPARNGNATATRIPIPSNKRPRRMRSVQGAAHYENGQKRKKGPRVSKKEYHDIKNSLPVPIFLEKTFVMISSCDPALASWTEDGTMFVIKDQKIFEQTIIPQFFDHKKFSSFARQLNFYGFRKVQKRAIYKNDFNKETAQHVTFFNKKFQRDRKDLLKGIQRSTKGGNSTASNQEQKKEINSLKDKVTRLESNIIDSQDQLNRLRSQINQLFSNQNGPQLIDHYAPLPVQVQVPVPSPPLMGSMGSGNQDNINVACIGGGSFGSNGCNQNHCNHNGNNLAPSISETDIPDNTMRNPSENSFLRGLSNSSLGDWVLE